MLPVCLCLVIIFPLAPVGRVPLTSYCLALSQFKLILTQVKLKFLICFILSFHSLNFELPLGPVHLIPQLYGEVWNSDYCFKLGVLRKTYSVSSWMYFCVMLLKDLFSEGHSECYWPDLVCFIFPWPCSMLLISKNFI